MGINGYNTWFVNLSERPSQLQHEDNTERKNIIVCHLTKLST